MRKVTCLLVGIFYCILISFSVKADVIWEPDNSFYWKHSEECEYNNRMFTANGPDNKVISYKSPEMPQEVETLENGYQVQIIFTYEDSDGILWGIYDNYQGTTGWVPMAYMEVVYDSISFEEDHEAQIVGETGSLDDKYVGETVYFWNYPGSESYISMELPDYTPNYGSLYVDGNGNRWGHVGYYFGIRSVWVCVDRPTADFEQLFPEGVPDVDKASRLQDTEKQEVEGQRAEAGRQDAEKQEIEGQGVEAGLQDIVSRIVPKLNPGLVAVAVILVVLVVAATAVLLVKLKGSKGRS